MEFTFDNVLSNKAKKNSKNANIKPYFENTNEIIGMYKNPSLYEEENEVDEDEKKGGYSLLKRTYGGACWKGYEQIGMKEKNNKIVPNCVPKKKGGNIKKTYKRVVDNYKDVVTHLEHHLEEKAGDPMDKKQSRFLKGEIKRINKLHLTPAMMVSGDDKLYKYSNPRKVQQLAFELFGKDAVIYKSDKPKKKYQILDRDGKFVYFGDGNMEDFNAHQDKERRRRYIARASKIRGKWKENPYSPNFLSLVLLWNADLSGFL